MFKDHGRLILGVLAVTLAACGGPTDPTGPPRPVPPPPPAPVEVLAVPVPSNGGIVTGARQIQPGGTIRLTAVANAGYDFVEWRENGAAVSAETTYTFTASANRSLTAEFTVNAGAGKWSPGGTFSDWFFPGTSYESHEWTFVPLSDPAASLEQEGLLHFYAYTFGVMNANANVGGGYAGFQSNGIILGAQRGKVINYSIWGSNGGKSSGWINAANSESGGYQLMIPYEWTEGNSYRFELREGPSGIDANGKWWGLWVTELESGTITFVGEQRVQTMIGGLDSTLLQPRTAMFGEDLHWWRSLGGQEQYLCSDFEPSAVLARDITADGGSVIPSSFSNFTNAGQPATGGNGYMTENCHVDMYTNDQGHVQHNLGFWPDPAPNGARP